MKFETISTDELSAVRNRSKWRNLVENFIESGEDAIRLTDLECSIGTAYRGIGYVAKKDGYPVSVARRGDNLYLLKKD